MKEFFLAENSKLIKKDKVMKQTSDRVMMRRFGKYRSTSKIEVVRSWPIFETAI